MKTALRGCGCIPWIMNGGAVFHSSHCQKWPNSRVSQHQLEGWRAANLIAKRAEEAETRALLRRSLLDHPAKGSVHPLRSVRDPAYVDAHIDDLDDA